MAATHTIARRKPATYGKASRKQLCHQLSSSTFDPLAPSLHISSPQSRAPASKLTTSDSLLLSYDDPRFSRTTKAPSKPKRSLARLPQSPTTLSEDRPTRRKANNGDKWDISSSDEGHTDGHTGLAGAGKRRKHSLPYHAASVINNQSRPILLSSEDELSSPAARLNHSVRSPESLPPGVSSNRTLAHSFRQVSIDSAFTEKLETSGTSAHETVRAREPQKSHVSHGQLSHKAPPSTPQQSTKATALASPSKAGQAHSHSARSTRLALQPLKGPNRTNESPLSTSRTPTSTRTSVEVTTPHQRELWGMLLQQASQSTSPTTAASLSSEPASRSAIIQSSATAKFADVVEQGSQVKPTPSHRRRLIDRLQPVARRVHESLRYSHDGEMVLDLHKWDSSASKKEWPPRIGDRPEPANDGRTDPSDPANTLAARTGQYQHLPLNGLKYTYSSERSHLENTGMDDTNFLDMPILRDNVPPGDALPSKRMRAKAPTLDATAFGDPRKAHLDGSQNSSMRTIHELRESGENARQINEIEALFDDIDGSSLIPVSLRRGKLLELATKIQEPAWCRLLLDQGLDRRLLILSALWNNDAVFNLLLASMLLHLIAAPFASPHLNDSRIADLFATRLKDDQDLVNVAQSRRSNISKRVQCEIKDYVDAVGRSNIWRSGAPTQQSGRMIGLQGLEYLVRKRREADCKNDVLQPKIIIQLVEMLPLPSEAPTLPLSTDELLETRLAISILESCTISGANHDDSQWVGATLAPILAILPRLAQVSLIDSEGTQRLALRLYLNLTNNNPRLCQEFAKVDVIRSILDIIESHSRILSNPEQQSNSPAALDTMILALGTLINLVEWSAAVRHIMISTETKDDCFVDTLVKLFTARLKIVAEVRCEEWHAA